MRALVLSGGGSRGAFQIGVLKRWMGEQGIDYDILCGVSVGALNVAGLAHIPKGHPKESIEWLENFWLSKVKNTSSIYRRWFPFGRLHSLWEKSVYDSSPLASLVRENVDIQKISTCNRKLAVGAVCLDTGKYVFGTEKDENFADWVLASASFPVFFSPTEINGQLYSDGGIINITPLGQAIRMGATEIDIIVCSDPFLIDEWGNSKKSAIPNQVLRVVNIMSNQVSKFDIEEIALKNKLAANNPMFKKIKVRVVKPRKNLNVDALSFDGEQIRNLIEIGYNDADNFMIYE